MPLRDKLLGSINNWWVALVLAAYPMSVMAAESIFAPTFGFTPIQAGYVIFMAFWGGLAAFTQQLAQNTVGARWKVILFSDMINATLAAFLVFLACVHWGVSPALSAIFYTLAGYGGSHFMKWAYKKWIKGVDALVDSKGSL